MTDFGKFLGPLLTALLIVIVLVAVWLYFWCYTRRRQKKQQSGKTEAEECRKHARSTRHGFANNFDFSCRYGDEAFSGMYTGFPCGIAPFYDSPCSQSPSLAVYDIHTRRFPDYTCRSGRPSAQEKPAGIPKPPLHSAMGRCLRQDSLESRSSRSSSFIGEHHCETIEECDEEEEEEEEEMHSKQTACVQAQ